MKSFTQTPGPALIAVALSLIAMAAGGTQAADSQVLTFLRPIHEINLASAESGVVSTILVKPGDKVKKGQEILRLNATVIEAQLAQAEAQALNEGRLKSAEAEYQISKQRLTILETLRNSGSTNQAEWDKAKATVAVAEGQYKAAQEESENLKHQAATIRAQFEQRILRSPIDGIVTEITRDAGEAVEARRADTPDYVAKIVDLSQLIARVHMPARLTEPLRLGQKLKLALDSSDAPSSRVPSASFPPPWTPPPASPRSIFSSTIRTKKSAAASPGRSWCPGCEGCWGRCVGASVRQWAVGSGQW
ncbi:efflux RND transporter periplasmic adaptor subunit, partial [Verrucomicrobium spinosum]|uniref:efflux RND transporter periplasmic adaptor subunit n=1 Tax=Verrucomicrobium spinosum TaxID=2736 RepID=UPI0009466144